MKLYISTHSGLKAIPDPPHGFGYLPIALPNEMLHKIQALDAHGHWERELSQLLTAETKRFFESRPIDAIRTPTAGGEIIKFFDPRDPEKHPLDRRPNVI